MAYTILIVDDEAEVRRLLRLYLENEGYQVIEGADGQQALNLFHKTKVDLCLLDVMMPVMDGYQLLQALRKETNIPVLMLSAKDADAEKILGLNLGADDYLSKPFNPLEAVARINAAIRRFYAFGSSVGRQAAEPEGESKGRPVLQVQDLALDLDGCTLYRSGIPIELTSIEFRIMELLMSHPGKVFTKQQIYEQGWGDSCPVSDNNIMVCISKLRTKLDEDPARYIKTIRGLGYRLEQQV